MTEKSKVDSVKAKEMQERIRERNLIVKEIRDKGSVTVKELSEATGIEKSRLLRHLIALRQFGKVTVVGERDDEFAYGLPQMTKS